MEDGGIDNPAFNHIELNSTDHSGKINGTRLWSISRLEATLSFLSFRFFNVF